MPKTYRQIAITVGTEEAEGWTSLAKTLGISRTEMFRRAVHALTSPETAGESGKRTAQKWLVIHHDDKAIFELLTIEGASAETAREYGVRFFDTDSEFVHVRPLNEVAALGWSLAVGELR